MTLSFDIARCLGTTLPECEKCRRREPGRESWQTFISPVWMAEDGCPNCIKQEQEQERKRKQSGPE
jgi:hypothetical protein